MSSRAKVQHRSLTRNEQSQLQVMRANWKKDSRRRQVVYACKDNPCGATGELDGTDSSLLVKGGNSSLFSTVLCQTLLIDCHHKSSSFTTFWHFHHVDMHCLNTPPQTCAAAALRRHCVHHPRAFSPCSARGMSRCLDVKCHANLLRLGCGRAKHGMQYLFESGQRRT